MTDNKSPQTNTLNGQDNRVHSSVKPVEREVRQNKDLPSKIANTTGDIIDSRWWDEREKAFKERTLENNNLLNLFNRCKSQRDKEIAELKDTIKFWKEKYEIRILARGLKDE